MALRQKTPQRALAEVRYLAARYPGHKITPVDNILPNNYFTDFLPELAKSPVGSLFYEVKSNLKPEQLLLLRAANVTELQPGIESLSDDSLRRMRKGVSVLQNVELLRRVKALGIKVYWNVLFGFPGETEAEYLEQVEVIRLIEHLPPPVSAARVRIDRFSPFYETPDVFGITDLRPSRAYDIIYPGLKEGERHEIAYYFDGVYDARERFEEPRRLIQQLVVEWREHHPLSFLGTLTVGDKTLLIDTRSSSKKRVTALSEFEVRVLRAAESSTSTDRIPEILQEWTSRSETLALVDRLVDQQLLLRRGNRVLSLVETDIPRNMLVAALAVSTNATAANGTEFQFPICKRAVDRGKEVRTHVG